MDEAWIGIIGVAVGGVLASVTALGTGMFQLRLARLQQEAQEKEADRQRRFDSVRDWREPRSKVYADFIAVADAVIQALVSGDTRFERSELTPASLGRRAARVSLFGPSSVADATVEVRMSIGRGDTDDARRYLAVFTEAARAALESHGEDASDEG